MRYQSYPHRHADAIIAHDTYLSGRFQEFMDVIEGISEEELIEDFCRQKAAHAARRTNFKSLTPSINRLLKERMALIPGWESEVDIFNDTSGVIGNTGPGWGFTCAPRRH